MDYLQDLVQLISTLLVTWLGWWLNNHEALISNRTHKMGACHGEAIECHLFTMLRCRLGKKRDGWDKLRWASPQIPDDPFWCLTKLMVATIPPC